MQYIVMYDKRSMQRETLGISVSFENVNIKSMEYGSNYLV